MANPKSFPYTIVDAFSSAPFGGNPAAVVLVDDDLKAVLTDDLMFKIAGEFNLSETAFITPTSTPGTYGLRWFTPTEEVNLCGHATLASGFALSLRPELSHIETFKFNTMSGELTTRKLQDGSLEMNFPAIMPQKIIGSEYSEYQDAIRRSIVGSSPEIKGIYAEEKYLVVEFDELASEQLGDWSVDVEHLVSGLYNYCISLFNAEFHHNRGLKSTLSSASPPGVAPVLIHTLSLAYSVLCSALTKIPSPARTIALLRRTGQRGCRVSNLGTRSWAYKVERGRVRFAAFG